LIHGFITSFEPDVNAIEIIHNPYSDMYVDGIIIREKSIAILSDDVVDDPINQAKTIDLDLFLNRSNDRETNSLNNRRKQLAQPAYNYFKEALCIHDKLEEIYIEQMDFSKADHVANEFINRLFKD